MTFFGIKGLGKHDTTNEIFFFYLIFEILLDNMPGSDRVLRPRNVTAQLQREDEEDALTDYEHDSEFESGNDSDPGSEYDGSDPEDMAEDELDSETENADLSTRVREARERGRPKSTLHGKNGYTWKLKKPQRTSDRFNQPVLVIIPSPINAAANCDSIEEFWEVLFSPDIIEDIVKFTNIQIEETIASLIEKEQLEQSYHHQTDVQEIRALIGLYYYSGRWKEIKVLDKDLWSVERGTTFYRCVFPLRRYNFLQANLRFDDRATRDPTDKFAPIRKIFEKFIQNCKDNYRPATNCTVDEQMSGFRGRCGFRCYMRNKPDKYGLLLITLNDATTSYLVNAIPRLGKNTVRAKKDETIPQVLLRQVTEPIHGINRNVTCDNLYTAIPLFEQMKGEPFNITMTGTIRKNKREIPLEMKVAEDNPPSSKFCHSDSGLTMVSFTPRKNKVLLLVSSFMDSEEIEENKPKIIHHYNATKGGTDSFDQLCKNNTVVRRSLRWPMRVFWGMLDQAVVNARVLWRCKLNLAGSQQKAPARTCMKRLYDHLLKPHLLERKKIPKLRNTIRNALDDMFKTPQPPPAEEENDGLLAKKRRCELCPYIADKKTRHQCISCFRAMCMDHRSKMCDDCACRD